MVDGSGLIRCFYINNNAEVEIDNLIVSNGGLSQNRAHILGLVGGGLYIGSGCVVTMRHCVITGSYASEGGGLYIDFEWSVLKQVSIVTLFDVIIRDNVAKTLRGGGIYIAAGPSVVNLIGCMFANNSAAVGGDLFKADKSSTLTIFSACGEHDTFNAGSGVLDCFGCNNTVPKDLRGGECGECATGSGSCCGALTCAPAGDSNCTALETSICHNSSAPPTFLPTPAPSQVPSVEVRPPTWVTFLASFVWGLCVLCALSLCYACVRVRISLGTTSSQGMTESDALSGEQGGTSQNRKMFEGKFIFLRGHSDSDSADIYGEASAMGDPLIFTGDHMKSSGHRLTF